MSQDINNIGYSRFMRDRQVEYKELVAKWCEYKAAETSANLNRLQVEKKILEIVNGDLRPSGINHLPDNLEITTGVDAKFDETEIDALYMRWQENLIPQLPCWPFKSEWKPDSKKMALLKETIPEIFKNVFRDALTVKPKKPSFAIKKGK